MKTASCARYLNLVQATLRTNFYQPDAAGKPKSYVSFKFDPGQDPGSAAAASEIRDLRLQPAGRGRASAHGLRRPRRHPLVRPARGLPHRGPGADEGPERQEHPHRAGGRQGRLRPEAPANGRTREEIQAEVVACYQTFIRGLLDLTDNIVAGRIAPPPRVIRRDGDDAYLVVAADKGTATFSDTANAISLDYGFWLGDAFASGGSAGYDHKKMAITARGAWECVKRHFREIGVDIQKTDFTVDRHRRHVG